MRRLMIIMSVLAMLLPTGAAAQAPEGDFASIPGLQQVIARSWTSPIENVLAPSTPLADATPVPSGGTMMLSIFVYAFDSAASAADAYPQLVSDTNDAIAQSVPDAAAQPIPLNGVGDQAVAALVPMPAQNQLLYATFGVIQRGEYVFTIAGNFVGTDGVKPTMLTANQLATAEAGSDAEAYNPDGTSQGGLWEFLAPISPRMMPGATVADLQIWSANATPGAESGDVVLNDLTSPYELTAINGVTEISGTRWQASEPSATPTAGVTRVDAWHIATSSDTTAGFVLFPLADILARDVTITDVVTAQSGSVTTTWQGWTSASGGQPLTIIVRQTGADLFAVVVIGDASRDVAKTINDSMSADAPMPPDKLPALQGLTQSPIVAATPAP